MNLRIVLQFYCPKQWLCVQEAIDVSHLKVHVLSTTLTMEQLHIALAIVEHGDTLIAAANVLFGNTRRRENGCWDRWGVKRLNKLRVKPVGTHM